MAFAAGDDRNSDSRTNTTGDPVLRAKSASMIGWSAIAAAAVVALLVILQVPAGTAVSMLGLPAFIAALGWACYLRPRVMLQRDGLVIVNIVRTYVVPFARIADMESRFNLIVETDGGKQISAWALPNNGRRVMRRPLGRSTVEPHDPSEINAVFDAYRVWLNTDTPSQVPPHADGRVNVTVQALPLVACTVSVLWALWGLGFSSVL